MKRVMKNHRPGGLQSKREKKENTFPSVIGCKNSLLLFSQVEKGKEGPAL